MPDTLHKMAGGVSNQRTIPSWTSGRAKPHQGRRTGPFCKQRWMPPRRSTPLVLPANHNLDQLNHSLGRVDPRLLPFVKHPSAATTMLRRLAEPQRPCQNSAARMVECEMISLCKLFERLARSSETAAPGIIRPLAGKERRSGVAVHAGSGLLRGTAREFA